MSLATIKNLLFFVMLIFVCPVVWGQTLSQLTKTERLNVLSSKDDTSRIRNLNKLGNMHMYLFVQYKRPENRDSMFLVYGQAMKVANNLKVNKAYWQNCVLNGIGEAECYEGDTTNGKKKLLKVIDFFSRNKYVDEELNAWRILSKTAEYYHKPKDGLVFMQHMETIALKNKRINVLVKIKERMIDLRDPYVSPDTIKDLYLKLVNDYRQYTPPDLDYAYLQLAHYYRYHGDLPKALYHALNARDWMIKTNDTTDRKVGDVNGELAEIYQELDMPAKSIEHYKKTIGARRHAKLAQVSIYRTAGFLVQEYINLKQAREGLAYITNLGQEFPPIDQVNEANLWQIKAYCYHALNNFKLAEDAYLKMMDGYIAAKQGGEELLIAKYDIAKYYTDVKQFKKASIYIDASLLNQSNPVSLKNVHYLLFKIDSANKDYLSAIKHFNSYKNISDDVFNDTKSKQISELEVKYATDQKERDITALKKDRLLQQEKTRQAEYTRNWILTAAFLLFLTVALLYNNTRISRKKTREIDRKNASLNQLVAQKDELLSEKEWLMKEVHHRVKNNLQIVMGLLQRQSSFIDNKEALAAIRNSEHRMQSIALIHQKLYQSDNLMLVSMADYIDEMIGYLKDCFDVGGSIRFERLVANVHFEVNMAVPLGLILNEAITNSIKYAYSRQPDFCIKVSLDRLSDDDYSLTIADNGPGLPADFDTGTARSMGFSLIRGLSRQLRGKLSLENNNGLLIKIIFRKNEA